MFRFVIPLMAAGIFDCDGDARIWVQFNSDDDIIEVEVTESADLGESVSEDLSSTTGAVVVGSVTVDPGSGPVGTLHTVQVNVEDEFADDVGRVTLGVDAGTRGIDDFELTRDSADRGLWQIEVESSGVAGESRTDTFTVSLFTEEEQSVEPEGTDAN